ncbi:asparagine--tRNA ligase, cytoplasmic 2-like [Cornus florida]|uniref:asparagine--tRNA ligase, cytoplasmic 2-like n=1 Tax=Cornus florida TaxID=4283 RepID=UPI0028A0061A|nr:asparagine--tRNA ligase, cytoplasmic 2-like [Cornus florida]
MASEQTQVSSYPKLASEQTQVAESPVTVFKYSKRVILKTVVGRSDGGFGLVGETILVGGWVKSSKEVKKEQPVQTSDVKVGMAEPHDVTCVEVLQSRIPFLRSILKVFGGGHVQIREKLDSLINRPPTPSNAFLQISDGSCVSSLQVLVESSIVPPSQIMPTGTCILVEGALQQPSGVGKHVIELKADKILHLGIVDPDKYPLSKKRLPLDMLRDFSHFRPRTTTVASVLRIRNALTQATHAFFQNNGFLYVQVPIITTTDSEGFSEKFQVTTLLSKEIKKSEQSVMNETEVVNLEVVKASIKEKSKLVEELKRTDSNKEALAAAIQDLRKTNELASQLEAREKSKPGTSLKTEKVDFSKDFFSRQTYLTASGRLHLESYACALGNVYSFGPRFRAEMSESKKSLAEMWMIELEMAFSELEDAMNCANDLLKFLCKWTLENCSEDLTFVTKRIDKTIVDRLQSMTSSSFKKISYAEAVEVLKQVTNKKFEAKIEFGASLTEEHESYLAEEIYQSPVIIYNYPKELKPFYVRLNDDGKTVAAFDVIAPKGGTLIRGSQNEERFEKLSSRIKELGLPREQYEWYLDLRRQGTVQHSGFSLVFDLMVLYATGLIDIKDAVPFPRSRGKANN